MSYKLRDPYFRRAKEEGYLARSVYKLQEIDVRYKLLRPGIHVIDLGAAPGSWTQYVIQKGGPTARVFAVDIQPLRWSSPQVEFLQMDVFSSQVERDVEERKCDGLLSDMAPATTGSRATDQVRSAMLVHRSLQLAFLGVRPGGFWVAKLLEGPERETLLREAQALFADVHVYRPKSTRKGSTECFLVGRGRLS
ncbi:MAG: RlmE family RNA methyltransferase [Bacteroidia bacterium]|nr:RlmE family RNA methyltransferase [Bacteroidia bacterium]